MCYYNKNRTLVSCLFFTGLLCNVRGFYSSIASTSHVANKMRFEFILSIRELLQKPAVMVPNHGPIRQLAYFRRLTLITFLVKLLLFLGILIWGKPLDRAMFNAYNPHWPSGESSPTWQSRLACMDVGHYLYLSRTGYEPNSASSAFYPLWPFLLWISRIGISSFAPVGASLLAVAFWIAGTLMLFRWSTNQKDQRFGYAVTLAVMVLPSSIYFWLGFTESLFFFLAVLYLTTTESNRWPLSVIASFLLPLTRPVGIFVIIIPFILICFSIRIRVNLFQLFAAMSGFGIYLATMWIYLGSPWEGFRAQSFYANSPSLKNMFQWDDIVVRFFGVDGFHTPTGSLLDRIMFICCCYALIRLWHIRPIWCFWSLPMFIVPALSTWFLSFSRFTIVIIPFTLCLGSYFYCVNCRIALAITILGVLVQCYLLNRFFSFGWAS